MMAEHEAVMNESYDSESSSYDDMSSSYGSAPRGKPGEFAKPVISGELLGTILQTLRSIRGLVGPLEAAPDKATFHQAVQQTASPMAGLMDMFGG